MNARTNVYVSGSPRCRSLMRRVLLVAVCVSVAFTARPAEVVRAGRWDLHSSFWINLHQTLMWDASTKQPRDLTALSAEERAAWDRAVDDYRRHGGGGSITFAEVMMSAQDDLTQVADDAVTARIEGPLAATVRSAAPVYRKHWWPADDRSNRFFIGYTAAMLRDAGEELALAHEAVYGHELPPSIRVDVAPYAGTFGGYTHDLRQAGLVVTISSRDDGYQGLSALEMILHESSHGIVGPYYGSVAKAIADAAKSLGVEVPRDLWHAILFATTSMLTKRALTARGNTSFVPSSVDLLTRAWPQYRKPIETHWVPYLEGKGTLREAIEKVVAATVAR